MKNTIAIIVSFILPIMSFADGTAYSKIVEFRIESENYLVVHYHNWSSKTRKSRYEMISTHQNPFDSSNDYAHVLCINKFTCDTVFKSPSPALTQIKISEDEKYIVGISNIMLWNPYQFVLFETSGSIIKKRHISATEAKLTPNEYGEFVLKFPKQNNFLDSLDRIHNIGSEYFIDFMSMGMPNRLGGAWKYLMKYYSLNYLSNNFSESVTNWINWYYRKTPDLKFEYKNEKLVNVSLLDPKKKRIRIGIK